MTTFIQSTCILFLSWLSHGLSAQPGVLDSNFASNGQLILSLDTFGDRINSAAIQNDGKIVFGGYSKSSFITSDFALLRCKQNGTLDSSFGVGGKAITMIENQSQANAIVLQNDGKIIIGGSSQWYINLVRYTMNGNLDSTFGIGGKIITDVLGYYSENCQSLAMQPDGKLLVGGYGYHNSNDHPHFIIIRYNTNGTLDSSFSLGGVFIGPEGKGYSMGLQSDGKIVLAGSFNFKFAVIRCMVNGAEDTMFGTNGELILPIGTSAEAYTLALRSNGKIILGGYSYDSSSNSSFTLAQIEMNGILDIGFGINGVVMTQVSSSSAVGHSICIQGDGKIVFCGKTKNSSGVYDVSLLRYDTNGHLDLSFGTAGQTITPIAPSYSMALSMAIQNDGKLVLGGMAYSGTKTDMALLRYHGDAGLGVPIIPDNRMRIYPNPCASSITIEFYAPPHDASLVLYNCGGQRVYQLRNISGKQVKISMSDLPTGKYFVWLMSTNGPTFGGSIFHSN